MSRLKETYEAIEDLKTTLYGEVKKPELYLIPMLAQIAVSLAVIADSVSKEMDT